MKKNRVRGFTLIELIIVMATFSIIMFGALQMMQPTNKLFIRSYNGEDVGAAEKQVKNYIDQNLRYAKYMWIDETLDTSEANLKARALSFAETYYNRKMIMDGTDESTLRPYEGTVYLMCIDNTLGGKISQWEFDFKAGDTGKMPTPVNAEIKQTRYTEWAVNKANYDYYNYAVSLGVTKKTAKSSSEDLYKLELDEDYKNTVAATGLQLFSEQNFSFTINAYKGDVSVENESIPGGGSAAVKYYKDPVAMTVSMSLDNCQGNLFEKSLYYPGWVEEPAGSGVYKHQDLTFAVGNVSSSANIFTNNIPADHYANPERIYIMYSYPTVDYAS
jgi:prepilin-type N-terminal cleavage/methylation domain-containing protein